MKSNLEKMADAGFSYIKRNYFDKDIDVYENEKGKIFYNRKTDAIVMQTDYSGECKFILKD